MVKKKSNIVSLDELTLSQIIVAHMREELKPKQVDDAKDLFVERIIRGEEFLRETYLRLRTRLLKTHHPNLEAFTNYYEYLKFLHKQTPNSVQPLIGHLEGREADLLKIYEQTFDPAVIRMKHPPGYQLKEEKLCIEIAHNLPPAPGKQVGITVVRRKDTARAIRKIAKRFIEQEIAKARYKKNPSRKNKKEKIDIDDWFAIKNVVYKTEQVHSLFNQLYNNLIRYNLAPDAHREPAITKEGLHMGRQPPGVDDHYLFGSGNDHLIQIKAQRTDGFRGFVEIAITDYVNMLIDEMDHINYRGGQDNALIPKKTSRHKNRFNELVVRGEELTERLPKKRRKILMPGEYF
jgi:hypothetical protein